MQVAASLHIAFCRKLLFHSIRFEGMISVFKRDSSREQNKILENSNILCKIEKSDKKLFISLEQDGFVSRLKPGGLNHRMMSVLSAEWQSDGAITQPKEYGTTLFFGFAYKLFIIHPVNGFWYRQTRFAHYLLWWKKLIKLKLIGNENLIFALQAVTTACGFDFLHAVSIEWNWISWITFENVSD